MTFLSFGDTYFLPRLRPGKPLHKWEIRANQNACLVDGVLYRHINPQSSYISDYKIVKIAADHSYMDVVVGSEVCRIYASDSMSFSIGKKSVLRFMPLKAEAPAP